MLSPHRQKDNVYIFPQTIIYATESWLLKKDITVPARRRDLSRCQAWHVAHPVEKHRMQVCVIQSHAVASINESRTQSYQPWPLLTVGRISLDWHMNENTSQKKHWKRSKTAVALLMIWDEIVPRTIMTISTFILAMLYPVSERGCLGF